MTVAEQLQARIDKIDTLLAGLEDQLDSGEGVKQSGDGPDRVTLQDNGPVYTRMTKLEQERDDKQTQLNRLNGLRRASSRRVIRC